MDKEQLLAALKAALESNNHSELEALSKEAVSTYPTEAFGYYYLAETLVREVPARYAQGEICLAKALEIESDNLDYLIRFAQLKDEQGKYEDAQLIWGKVLNKDADNAEALFAKGSFQIREYQDYEQGLDFLNKAIAANDDNLESYLYRAEAYNGLEKNEEALADLNKVLESGFNEVAVVLKITLLKALGKAEEIPPLYEELIAETPEGFTYLFNYGQELLDQEEFDLAVEKLKAATELLEEEHPMFYRTLGQASLYALQLDEAVTAFQKCIEMDPEDTESFLMLIETKIEQEKFAEALDDIEILLKKAGDDKSLSERALLQKGMALMASGKLDDAEKTFMPLAKAKGLRQKNAFYGLGMVYLQKGDPNKAYKFMKTAKAANHPLAQEYINAFLQDFLKEAKDRSLKANAEEFDKNAASPLMQKLFGKLWKFSDLESKKLSKIPPEFADKIKASMQMFSILLTEKGAILVSDDTEEILTYRIKKEASSAALVEFLPLDNFPGFIAKLKLAEDGFAFSKEENEIMHLKNQDLASVPAGLVENYKKHIQREEVAYLGDKADTVLNKLL